MTPTRLRVEVEDFVDASRTMYGGVGEPVRVSFGRLCASLAGLGSMAGDDPGGQGWARAYDRAARSTLQATGQIVNAAYATSSMFGRSGLNYAEAESASTVSGVQSMSTSVLIQRLPADAWVGPAPALPSAAGGGGDPPPGWWLVQHTVGYVWPDGHQDKLRTAGSAWAASAGVLADAASQASLAGVMFAVDRLPEADDILTVCRGMNSHLLDLAAAHRSLAGGCTDLARHIDQCHAAVADELQGLLVEAAAIQIGGALLSAVTFGIAEAPTQVAQGVRIAAVAARVGELIATFSRAAKVVAEVFPTIAAATERIRAVMHTLATTRLAVAGMSQVPNVARSGRVAKIARTPEIAAAQRLAHPAKSLIKPPKLPSRLVGRKPGGPGVWCNSKSLAKHFRKHGKEMGLSSAEEYSTKASDLLHRAIVEGLPRKIDPNNGTVRVFDPANGTFGSYRPDGSTITMFKPSSPAYFDRQPGALQ